MTRQPPDADIDVVVSEGGTVIRVVSGHHVHLCVRSWDDALPPGALPPRRSPFGDHTVASAVQAAALILQQRMSDAAAENKARAHAAAYMESAMEAMRGQASKLAGHEVNDGFPAGTVEKCGECGYPKPVGAPCPTCELLRGTGEESVVAATGKGTAASGPRPPTEATHCFCSGCDEYVRPEYVAVPDGHMMHPRCPKCRIPTEMPTFAYDIRAGEYVEVGSASPRKGPEEKDV